MRVPCRDIPGQGSRRAVGGQWEGKGGRVDARPGCKGAAAGPRGASRLGGSGALLLACGPDLDVNLVLKWLEPFQSSSSEFIAETVGAVKGLAHAMLRCTEASRLAPSWHRLLRRPSHTRLLYLPP